MTIKMQKLVKSWRQPVTFDMNAALIYADSLASAKEQRDIFQQVGLYEDLVANPSATVERLFKDMGIEEDISVGLTAMDIESQNGVFSYKVSKDVSPSTVAGANQINRDFHLNFPYNCTMDELRSFLRNSFPNAQY